MAAAGGGGGGGGGGSTGMRRGLSVKLTAGEVSDIMGGGGGGGGGSSGRGGAEESYVLDGAVFVRDNVAILPNGVAMKDAPRTFVVEPDSLEYGEVLGRGASSYVQAARHVPTGTALALKVINMFDKSKRGQLTREIQALYDADCDCLVSFYGAFHREGAISLALEYMDAGTIAGVLRAKGAFPEPALAAVAFQVLWALAYLRVEKRLHRDIKPSNILLNHRGQVKLSDFGLSSELQHSIGMAATFTGTCRYMSPERIAHKPYSFPSDIWSLGVVLVEAALGAYPFPECATYIEMAEAIVEAPEPTIPPAAGFSLEFTQFVASCLKKNPDERLPAEILLGSPWFGLHGIRSVETAVATMAAWLATFSASEASSTLSASHPSADAVAASAAAAAAAVSTSVRSPVGVGGGSSPAPMHIPAASSSAAVAAAARAALVAFDDSALEGGRVASPASRRLPSAAAGMDLI